MADPHVPRQSLRSRISLARLQRLLGRERRRGLVRRLDGYLVRLHEGYENRNYDYYTNGERRVIETVRNICQPSVILDVGANVGGWTTMTADTIPDAKVFSFEPLAEAHELLAAAVVGRPNLIAVNLALGDEPGERDIHYHPAGTGLATFVDGFSESFHGYEPQHQRIRVTTGDLFCSEHGLERIDFLKIDVEGYEDRVLRGFARMLEDQRIDVIQFEYGYTSIATGFLLKDFYELLQPYGMVIGKIYPTHVDFREYRYEHEDFIGPNFLAVRNSLRDVIEALSC